jgi:uncharacterized membrane protein
LATIDQLLFALTLSAALGCGLIAGVFFAFSNFVMRALARLTPAEGVRAMQSVNVAVINPWFMAAFLGTAAARGVALIVAPLRWREPGAAYMLAGGALYLAGSFLVTIVFNVPRNEALAAVAPEGPDAAGLRAAYVSEWTAWNHVRTASSLAAGAAFVLALRVSS